MKKHLFLFFLFPSFVFAQEPKKGDNTIITTGIDFRHAVNELMDEGYTIEKIDSNFKTARTEFINCPLKTGKASMVNISISIRIKDSSCIITGRWYSELFLANGFGASKPPGPTDIYPIVFTWGANKLTFLRMDHYAKSLKGEISYAKK